MQSQVRAVSDHWADMDDRLTVKGFIRAYPNSCSRFIPFLPVVIHLG
jgi:hypothetical protein